MPHQLIVGMTMSGKSTLAKLMIDELKKRGCRTAVLDPLGDPEFAAEFATKDSDAFLNYAKVNQSCFLFVDEGSQAVGRYNREMDWLVTTGRHCGHLTTLITHGATDISPTVRGQCDKVYLFCCSQNNAKIIADEWNEPELLKADRLPRFHFYIVSRFRQLQKGEILLDKRTVTIENVGQLEQPAKP